MLEDSTKVILALNVTFLKASFNNLISYAVISKYLVSHALILYDEYYVVTYAYIFGKMNEVCNSLKHVFTSFSYPRIKLRQVFARIKMEKARKLLYKSKMLQMSRFS